MRAIDIARDTLAALEHDGTKPSFHELSKALDAIEAELTDRYVALPLGADGVPLRVGDEIEYPNGARDTVRFATISPIGWAVNDRGWVPEVMRHHHPPTIEDVLREFAEKITDSQIPNVHPTYEEAIAEYAKRLRLAEEEGE